ncbi:MAG TPA: hypothetical protein VK646_04640 [Actinomycetota bacterium]|nr:hypothetical protein [Actinomycetota bacterium]
MVPAITIAALLSLAACSSSSSSTAPPATTVPATSASATTTTSPSGSGNADLTGTWSGTYNGAYTGTFKLTWTENGSDLSGTIDLSSTKGAVPIHGSVHGDQITFGTVGSTVIRYSGTAHGSSMSGTYQVVTSSGSTGGDWIASKTA